MYSVAGIEIGYGRHAEVEGDAANLGMLGPKRVCRKNNWLYLQDSSVGC